MEDNIPESGKCLLFNGADTHRTDFPLYTGKKLEWSKKDNIAKKGKTFIKERNKIL